MRVLITGDSHRLQTGFGRVNQIAVKAFQDQGWEVAEVAGLTTEPPKEDDGVHTFTPTEESDILGLKLIEGAINDFQPDFVYCTTDPGSLTALSTGIPQSAKVLSYAVVEGEPLVNRTWMRILSQTESLMACSQYGASILKRSINREVPWAYHGVNHEVFNTEYRSNGMREDVRKIMGWEDKFVITCVAQNVHRKQITRLIEALAILKYEYKQEDIVLYLHTVPYMKYWLDGWNLFEIASDFNVAKQVVFHYKMTERNASIPLRSDDPNEPGLVNLMNSADLFVLPSQVEGFGLPAAESMACGLPVLVTKYAAGWEIVKGAGRGIDPVDYEIHKSGTRYANVSPRDLAKEILRLKRNPKELARMSANGVIRAQDFQWSKFTDLLIDEANKLVNGDQERDIPTEETNTGAKASTWAEEHLQEHAVEDNLSTDLYESPGQIEDSYVEAP